jgi:hypothetical protein
VSSTRASTNVHGHQGVRPKLMAAGRHDRRSRPLTLAVAAYRNRGARSSSAPPRLELANPVSKPSAASPAVPAATTARCTGQAPRLARCCCLGFNGSGRVAGGSESTCSQASSTSRDDRRGVGQYLRDADLHRVLRPHPRPGTGTAENRQRGPTASSAGAGRAAAISAASVSARSSSPTTRVTGASSWVTVTIVSATEL